MAEPSFNEYRCPKCNAHTTVEPDPSYQGEMRVCRPCSFYAYFDQWSGVDGAYHESRVPF